MSGCFRRSGEEEARGILFAGILEYEFAGLVISLAQIRVLLWMETCFVLETPCEASALSALLEIGP